MNWNELPYILIGLVLAYIVIYFYAGCICAAGKRGDKAAGRDEDEQK